MSHQKFNSTFFFLFLIITSISIFAQDISNPDITSEEIKEHITFLASDELKGRDSGTDEIMEAAEYIADEFAEYGLSPAFDGDYFQAFPFIKTIKLTENNSLAITADGEEINFQLSEEFTTVPFSGNAVINADLVFAGFGISASDLNYDDYDGIDVKDKVVVVFRNTPEPSTPHSEFDAYSPLRKKGAVARDKGAVGIIFINPYDKNLVSDDLVEFSYDRGGSMTDFAVVNMKRDRLEEIMNVQTISLEEVYNQIIETKNPSSFAIENVTVQISTEIEEVEATSWNVGGTLAGNHPQLKNEWLIIGAHFDHLGMGEFNSTSQSQEPQIHNGADDNASGTTGVLELAQKFASQKDKLKRSIAFFAFSGEELGLLGSDYLVNNLPFPTEDAITMINMDMIGRLKDSLLIVYGTGTSSNWKDILNQENVYGFKLTFKDEGYGPSDHSSFYGKKIPVLFFFTDLHEDYHKPSDDANKINYEGEKKVLEYVYNIAMDINLMVERPDYILIEKRESEQMFIRRVWFGTIPDFASNVDGYKLGGVSEGGPAQQAGLLAGDIVIEFGGKKIGNIYDITYALSEFVPGDVVDVIVKRGEEEITFKVKLAAR